LFASELIAEITPLLEEVRKDWPGKRPKVHVGWKKTG